MRCDCACLVQNFQYSSCFPCGPAELLIVGVNSGGYDLRQVDGRGEVLCL